VTDPLSSVGCPIWRERHVSGKNTSSIAPPLGDGALRNLAIRHRAVADVVKRPEERASIPTSSRVTPCGPDSPPPPPRPGPTSARSPIRPATSPWPPSGSTSATALSSPTTRPASSGSDPSGFENDTRRPLPGPVGTGNSVLALDQGRHRPPVTRATRCHGLIYDDRNTACPGTTQFPAPTGPIRINSFRRRFWNPAVERAGLDGLAMHGLRHTAVAMWIEAGASPTEIAARAGHR